MAFFVLRSARDCLPSVSASGWAASTFGVAETDGAAAWTISNSYYYVIIT